MTMAELLWADRRHRDYEEARIRRKYARDHFSGEVHDIAIKASGQPDLQRRRHTNLTENSEMSEGIRIYFEYFGGNTVVGKYLIKRSQGEADEAYKERVRISRYANHMATLVEAFLGGVFQVEDKAERVWADPLGKPETPGTPMHSLWRDIDGAGTNWYQFIIGAGADLIVDNMFVFRVDREAPNSPLRVYRVDPDSVVNWREEEGVLVELLTHEIAYLQDSLMDEPREVEYYTHYTLDGWILYWVVEDDKGNRTLQELDSGAWEYPLYTAPDQKTLRLPFGRVILPVKRPLGYQMAQDANFLYNLFSDGRWILRVLNYPRLSGDVDDAQWNNSMEALAAGWNGLQGRWTYISPDAANAKVAHDIYHREVRDFYISNHQKANESAIEKSATEVLYNEAAGRTAFLTLFAGAIDEIENGILFLLAQMEAPENPDSWLASSIERTRDFKPINIEAVADSRATRFAQYANVLPAPLALELAGHPESDVKKAEEFNPAPEERQNGINPFDNAGDGAAGAQDQFELGAGPVGGDLQDLATGSGGSA